MDKLRYTRFNNIYESRAAAIKRLDTTSRYYAENVCIRYWDNGKIQIMLALYRSTARGDYDINFDSGNPRSGGETSSTHVQRVHRLKNETDKECLGRLYFDRLPNLFDVVIIVSEDKDDDIYIWTGSIWISLKEDITILGEKTATAATSAWVDDNGDYHVSVHLPLDGESLTVNPDTGLICVGVIDGGTL